MSNYISAPMFNPKAKKGQFYAFLLGDLSIGDDKR